MEKVKLSFKGEIAKISLNRPEKRMLNHQVLIELREAIDAVKILQQRCLCSAEKKTPSTSPINFPILTFLRINIIGVLIF